MRGGSSLRRRARAALRALRRRLPVARATVRRVYHPICNDLAAWTRSWKGAEYVVIDPAFSTSRPLPRTVELEVDPRFIPLCSCEVPERALVTIPNARLRGQTGMVVLPSGEFARELVAREGPPRLLQAERD